MGSSSSASKLTAPAMVSFYTWKWEASPSSAPDDVSKKDQDPPHAPDLTTPARAPVPQQRGDTQCSEFPGVAAEGQDPTAAESSTVGSSA